MSGRIDEERDSHAPQGIDFPALKLRPVSVGISAWSRNVFMLFLRFLYRLTSWYRQPRIQLLRPVIPHHTVSADLPRIALKAWIGSVQKLAG